MPWDVASYCARLAFGASHDQRLSNDFMVSRLGRPFHSEERARWTKIAVVCCLLTTSTTTTTTTTERVERPVSWVERPDQTTRTVPQSSQSSRVSLRRFALLFLCPRVYWVVYHSIELSVAISRLSLVSGHFTFKFFILGCQSQGRHVYLSDSKFTSRDSY